MSENESGSAEDDGKGKGLSRRGFLKAAAVGAAAAGVGALAPKVLMSATNPGNDASSDEADVIGRITDPVVAYVRDVSTGEVVVMMGTKELVVRDQGLAARLARIAVG